MTISITDQNTDDAVRPATDEEMSLLRDVSSACGRPLDELIRVWRLPSFSIASINSSGSGNKTVIPRKVSTDISMRIVPDQDLETIVEGLKQFCRKTFQGLESPNKFEVSLAQMMYLLTLIGSFIDSSHPHCLMVACLT